MGHGDWDHLSRGAGCFINSCCVGGAVSYASYATINSINSYEDAVRHINATAPIRNSKNIIPLGARRYHDAYSIRTNGLVIECLLYENPIVSFHSSGTITIASGIRTRSGSFVYSDVTEAYFIKNLLRHYVADAVMHKRTLRMTLVDGRKVSLRAGEPLVVQPSSVGGKNLTFVSEARLRGWRLDRKACNVVRKQYGDFYRYVKGMVSLRKETVKVAHYQYKDTIAIHSSEMDLGVPQYKNRPTRPNKHWLTSKPMVGEVVKESWCHEMGVWDRRPVNLYDNWVKNVEGLLTFVRDEGETQHESWHKAFLMLAYSAQFREVFVDDRDLSLGGTYLCKASDVPKVLDEIIFKWHSKEVFELVTLEVGQVPNPEYESWVDRHPKPNPE